MSLAAPETGGKLGQTVTKVLCLFYLSFCRLIDKKCRQSKSLKPFSVLKIRRLAPLLSLSNGFFYKTAFLKHRTLMGCNVLGLGVVAAL
jgi:hypothetical protein